MIGLFTGEQGGELVPHGFESGGRGALDFDLTSHAFFLPNPAPSQKPALTRGPWLPSITGFAEFVLKRRTG
ncbi:hypothetical protein GCM10010449_28490 [Streptomyces rectiviolaceus]|uniref:Uncharacterized protein n=1 Tax=Streptomyces rectiviolaceus TaxID=332591 RepID=A0ABP6MDP9_9ACTN